MPRGVQMRVGIGVLLTLVLMFSGCTDIIPVSPEQQAVGVIFTKFEPDTRVVEGTGNEKVELFLEVKNIGDALASNVHAEIFNYGTGLAVAPESVGEFSFGNLEPPVNGVPGERESYSFVFNVVGRELGMEDNIDIGARLVYYYDSRGRGEVTIVPKSEYRAGIPITIAGEGYSSNGPVKVTVHSEQPVIVSDVVDSFSVYVDLENIGIGRLRSIDHGYDYVDYVDLYVPAGFNVSGYCDFKGDLDMDAGGIITMDHVSSSTANERLGMVDGKTRKLLCRLRVNSTEIQDSYEFKAIAGYRYQQDSFTQLQVHGLED